MVQKEHSKYQPNQLFGCMGNSDIVMLTFGAFLGEIVVVGTQSQTYLVAL